MLWKGPFKTPQKIENLNCKIMAEIEEKNYHANMLKKYYMREEQAEIESEKED